MERGNKEKILEMIKAIENKNSEMEQYISNLSLLSRNDMLKKITQDIINNNSLLQEFIEIEAQVILWEDMEKSHCRDKSGRRAEKFQQRGQGCFSSSRSMGEDPF